MFTDGNGSSVRKETSYLFSTFSRTRVRGHKLGNDVCWNWPSTEFHAEGKKQKKGKKKVGKSHNGDLPESIPRPGTINGWGRGGRERGGSVFVSRFAVKSIEKFPRSDTPNNTHTATHTHTHTNTKRNKTCRAPPRVEEEEKKKKKKKKTKADRKSDTGTTTGADTLQFQSEVGLSYFQQFHFSISFMSFAKKKSSFHRAYRFSLGLTRFFRLFLLINFIWLEKVSLMFIRYDWLEINSTRSTFHLVSTGLLLMWVAVLAFLFQVLFFCCYYQELYRELTSAE